MLVVAASALSAFDLTQRSYRGFQWTAALWLNAAGAAAVALVEATAPEALALLQMVFVPWPLLCLLGLRRFHARLALPGSALADSILLGMLLAIAMLAPRWISDPPLVERMPWLAASAALLYAAMIAWFAPRGQEARSCSRWARCGGGGCAAGAGFGRAGGTGHGAAGQRGRTGRMVMAFMALAMSSQRTERELRQSRSRLRVLANIDMLTQVPNRRRFEELARRALQSDEDGSAALRARGHRPLQADQRPARPRGWRPGAQARFALHAGIAALERRGGSPWRRRVRDAAAPQFDAGCDAGGRAVGVHLQQQAHAHALPRLTLSFGIVQMRRGESIDETLHRADLALYEAKRLGRSRAVAADGDPEQPVFRSSERLGLTSS